MSFKENKLTMKIKKSKEKSKNKETLRQDKNSKRNSSSKLKMISEEKNKKFQIKLIR